MKLVVALVLVAALASPLSAQASNRGSSRPFEFRSHVLGDSLQGLESCDPSDESCFSTSDMIGDTPVDIVYNLVNGRFEGFYLQFKPDAFESLRDAFVTKWGAPTSTDYPIFETRGGAKAGNTVLRWKFAHGTLTLSKFGGSLLDGNASIYTPRYRAAQDEKRKRDAARAAGKDM